MENKIKDSDSIVLKKNYVKQANKKIVIDLCKGLILDDEDLFKVKSLLLKEIKKGLCKRTHKTSNVKCLLTYIEQLPKGCEKGRFLYIEVDGVKFRISLLHLQGMDIGQIDTENYKMPMSMLTAEGEDFFNYIATCFYKFVYKYELEYEDLNIGLLFKFPLRKVSLTKGVLIRWDKGFTCSGVVGHDIVELLQQAIKQKGNFKINVIVLVTETANTLIMGALLKPTTKIAVTVGERTNACYLEQTKHIELFQSNIHSSHVMIINTHWANFGDNGVLNFLRENFDKLVDKATTNPGKHTFEKMIAGKYLGEIARLIMIDCIQAGALLDGVISEEMKTPFSFKTEHLIDIINEGPNFFVTGNLVLQQMSYTNINPGDANNILYICKEVITRGAKLIAAAVACLIDYIGDPYTTIAWDGCICHSLPLFSEIVSKTIKVLARPEHKFQNTLPENGALGGAILAAVTAQEKKKQQISKSSRFTY